MGQLIVILAILFLGLIIGLFTCNLRLILEVLIWLAMIVGMLGVTIIPFVTIILQEAYYPGERIMLLPIGIGCFVAYGIIYWIIDDLLRWFRSLTYPPEERRYRS